MCSAVIDGGYLVGRRTHFPLTTIGAMPGMLRMFGSFSVKNSYKYVNYSLSYHWAACTVQWHPNRGDWADFGHPTFSTAPVFFYLIHREK